MEDFEIEFSEDPAFADLNTSEQAEIREMIAKIEDSHHLRYKMMNLEAWSLAETMDQFLPGFWSRFLENRRKALKQFIAQKREYESNVAASDRSIPQKEENSYDAKTSEVKKRAS